MRIVNNFEEEHEENEEEKNQHPENGIFPRKKAHQGKP